LSGVLVDCLVARARNARRVALSGLVLGFGLWRWPAWYPDGGRARGSLDRQHRRRRRCAV